MRKTCDENTAVFQGLFEENFRPLTKYAFRIVNDWGIAEDIVQDVFVALWDKQGRLDLESSLKPYLYRAVYNRAINYINSSLGKAAAGSESIDDLINREILSYNQYNDMLLGEIQSQVDAFVATLPPQCSRIYHMSRTDNLKNKEIAALIGISEKAVEKNLTKALTEIRRHLIKLDLLYLYLTLLTITNSDKLF